MRIQAGWQDQVPAPGGGWTFEMDGRLRPHSIVHPVELAGDRLGLPVPIQICWQPAGGCTFGCAEFAPDDDGDNLVFWSLGPDGLTIRVQNVAIKFGLRVPIPIISPEEMAQSGLFEVPDSLFKNGNQAGTSELGAVIERGECP